MTATQRVVQILLIVAEIGLVLIILALLLAIWMPAIVGVHPERIVQ